MYTRELGKKQNWAKMGVYAFRYGCSAWNEVEGFSTENKTKYRQIMMYTNIRTELYQDTRPSNVKSLKLTTILSHSNSSLVKTRLLYLNVEYV